MGKKKPFKSEIVLKLKAQRGRLRSVGSIHRLGWKDGILLLLVLVGVLGVHGVLVCGWPRNKMHNFEKMVGAMSLKIEISWLRWRTLWRWWAFLGAVVWGLALFAPLQGVAAVKGLGLSLLLAPLVLVPLAMSMFLQEREGDARVVPVWAKWSMYWQPVASLGGVTSLVVGPGLLGILLASAWAVQTGMLALLGAWRLSSQRGGPLEEVAWDVGLLYLPVAGAWWLAYMMHWQVMGFPLLIVYLTAIHFHYAGFTVSVTTGLCGRWLRAHEKVDGWRWLAFHLGGAVVIVCPILVAIGFVFSSVLQVTMAVVLAFGMLTMAAVIAFGAVPLIPQPPSQFQFLATWLLRIAAAALIFTMALAVLYAVGEFQHVVWINIPQMAVLHGMTNVYGYSLCSLLAWWLLWKD